MGEAKLRRERDAFFGIMPKDGYGVVVSPQVYIERGKSLRAPGGGLDPYDLRHALLFWERLAWPDNNYISIGSSDAEVDFLVASQIMTRPRINLRGALEVGDAYARAHAEAFERLEKNEPGRWSIYSGQLNILEENNTVSKDRGLLVELHRAIPIPERDVPLEDVLAFKERRRDELLGLRFAISNYYRDICKSGDPEFLKAISVDDISLRCAESLRVAREASFPFRVGSMSLDFSLSLGAVASMPFFSEQGANIGAAFGLATVGGVVGGALPFLTVGKGVSLRRKLAKINDITNSSPFRVVSKIHEEL